MIQFTREEQAVLHEKILTRPDILNQHKEGCEPLLKYGLHIPHGQDSTWIMDFEYPEDSAKLLYNYGDPDHYECPLCHRVYSGRPYSGSWWRYTIDVVEGGGYKAGLICMLTGDKQYRQLCKDVLMGFAEAYPTYEEHREIPYNNPGLMSSQTLCEALCIKPLALCYDLVEELLSEEEKKQVFEDMFAPSMVCLRKYRKDILHNHEVVVDMAMGVIGILTGDEVLLDFAVFGKYGLPHEEDPVFGRGPFPGERSTYSCLPRFSFSAFGLTNNFSMSWVKGCYHFRCNLLYLLSGFRQPCSKLQASS